jgi:hypothetical protein
MVELLAETPDFSAFYAWRRSQDRDISALLAREARPAAVVRAVTRRKSYFF